MPPLRDNLLIVAVFMALLLAALLLTGERKSRSDCMTWQPRVIQKETLLLTRDNL